MALKRLRESTKRYFEPCLTESNITDMRTVPI
jgi:hypothetical protein